MRELELTKNWTGDEFFKIGKPRMSVFLPQKLFK